MAAPGAGAGPGATDIESGDMFAVRARLVREAVQALRNAVGGSGCARSGAAAVREVALRVDHARRCASPHGGGLIICVGAGAPPHGAGDSISIGKRRLRAAAQWKVRLAPRTEPATAWRRPSTCTELRPGWGAPHRLRGELYRELLCGMPRLTLPVCLRLLLACAERT